MSGSKYESRLARLERQAARRRKRVDLAPPRTVDGAVPSARRLAVLEQLRAELLLGIPREHGPFPSTGFAHPLAAELYRLRPLQSPRFEALEACIASDPEQVGPRVFGATVWPSVRQVFGGRVPARKRAQLEDTDIAAWRKALWSEYLSSDEGRAAVESGRITPAASDVAARASNEGAV